MNEYTNKENCISNKDDHDFYKPLFLNNSAYEYYSGSKNADDIGPLTIWKLENVNNNDECIKNNSHENLTIEDKIACNEECIHIKTLNKLRQIVEFGEKDLKDIHTLKNVIPGDNLYNMPIDINDDNCGESLKDIQLEGEYLQIGDLNSNDPYKEIKTFVKENEQIIDEPKSQPIDKVNSDQINYENGSIKKKKIESDDSTNENKIKPELASSDKITTEKEKRALKTSKKRKKCLKKNNQTDKSNNGQRNNGYNIEYLYTYGESYRGGIYCGHKKCVDNLITIPRNKGWITDSFLNQVNDSIKI